MGRFKTQQERDNKKTDEEKEAEELETLDEIRRVPGWTGDHEKDSMNPNIQNIIKRRHLRQKV